MDHLPFNKVFSLFDYFARTPSSSSKHSRRSMDTSESLKKALTENYRSFPILSYLGTIVFSIASGKALDSWVGIAVHHGTVLFQRSSQNALQRKQKCIQTRIHRKNQYNHSWTDQSVVDKWMTRGLKCEKTKPKVNIGVYFLLDCLHWYFLISLLNIFQINTLIIWIPWKRGMSGTLILIRHTELSLT